jgi:hypothetical protein
MRHAPPTTRPSVLLPPSPRPGISRELAWLLWALAYGVLMGAAIASALWWWLG